MRPNVVWEPHFAVCRIFVGHEFRGHGFVVPYGDIAFACKHSLVGRPAECTLSFPALQDKQYRGVLDECGWFEDEDIAILRVEPPIDYPCAGLALRLPHERPQQCYSFILTDHYSDGNHVYLKLGGRDTSHRHQLHPEHAPHDAYEIEPGCSGAPVFDLLGNAVWGMIVAVDASWKRIAKAIPADVLWDAFERFRKCMEERHGRRLSSLRVPEPRLADPAREVIAAATETVERTEPEEALGAKIVDWFRDGMRSLLALSWCASFGREVERALAEAREEPRFDALAKLLDRGPEAAPGALAVLSRSERTSHLLARGAVRFAALMRETTFPAGEGRAGVWRLPVRGKLARFEVARGKLARFEVARVKLARFEVAPAVASALQSWQEAVELAQDDPWPCLALARACHRAGHPLEAIALLIRAFETAGRAGRALPEGITERLLDEFGFAVLGLAPTLLEREELRLALEDDELLSKRYEPGPPRERRATLNELLRRAGDGPIKLAEPPVSHELSRKPPTTVRVPWKDVRRAARIFALWFLELPAAPWGGRKLRHLLRSWLDRRHFRREALEALARHFPVERTRALLERRAVEDENWSVRREALGALARHFPDERTRALLERRAVEDPDEDVRREALEALARHFPDERTRAPLERRAVEDPDEDVRRDALEALARHLPDERTRALLERRAVEDPDEDVRHGALGALARHFPDERTRALLERRAVEDPDEDVRRDALEALAERFPDERTRALLERRAVEDPDEDVRRDALEALAERFPDERTRALLERRAVEDEDWSVRREALGGLARHFPDERTRDFVRRRTEEDPEAIPYPDALGALAARFPEEWIRGLLERRAVEDEDLLVRRKALGALAERFPDARTRALLERRAVDDPDELPRKKALEALAENFPDERTRDFVRRRTEEDPEAIPYPDALGALAARFPEEWIRALLERRAVEDENLWVRRGALKALAERFPDERTRALLERRAVEDEDWSVRRDALGALAERFPDARTRALLERRAVEDPHEWPRGLAKALLERFDRGRKADD